MMLAVATAASAQWDIQESGTKASLRGIHSLGKGIAWASGTDGTVLRTEDGGYLWQHCTVPPGAEKLDFRGVQGFDENTALVMSSGKGDLSRLYKTTDGCQTWKLLYKNPDKEGFWDALLFSGPMSGLLLGDPVDGKFWLSQTADGGAHWRRQNNRGLQADAAQQGAFAASNSSIYERLGGLLFGTGGTGGAVIYERTGTSICLDDCPEEEMDGHKDTWTRIPLPLGSKTEASGIFSINGRTRVRGGSFADGTLIAVGGDYLKPNDIAGTAAYSTDAARHWTASATPPNGYRSAVAYDSSTKTWITVGPNGTDVSTDDGRNWRALKPGPNDAADADKNWNALSLPFVVGPHGRIGLLRPSALSAKP